MFVFCILDIISLSSLGMTADLIGENTDSSALIYGLMSLTDKVANGLAVVLIQKQVPCLRLYGLVPLDPPPILATLAPGCVTPLPTEIPSYHSHCFSFYKNVLFYSTGGSAVFGGLFVITCIVIATWKRKTKKDISFLK